VPLPTRSVRATAFTSVTRPSISTRLSGVWRSLLSTSTDVPFTMIRKRISSRSVTPATRTRA
jgi:hypothetical protein